MSARAHAVDPSAAIAVSPPASAIAAATHQPRSKAATVAGR